MAKSFAGISLCRNERALVIASDRRRNDCKELVYKNTCTIPLDIETGTDLVFSGCGAPGAKSRPFTKSSVPPSEDLALLLVLLSLEEVVTRCSPDERRSGTRALADEEIFSGALLLLSSEDGSLC